MVVMHCDHGYLRLSKLCMYDGYACYLFKLSSISLVERRFWPWYLTSKMPLTVSWAADLLAFHCGRPFRPYSLDKRLVTPLLTTACQTNKRRITYMHVSLEGAPPLCDSARRARSRLHCLSWPHAQCLIMGCSGFSWRT